MTSLPFKAQHRAGLSESVCVGGGTLTLPLPLLPRVLGVISVVKPPCYPLFHLYEQAFITVAVSSI